MNYLVIVSLFLFLTGLIILYYFYVTQKPIPLEKLKYFVGDTVLVSGKVLSISKTHSGNTKLEITDGNATAYVVLFSSNVSCKDILVVGKVKEFMGKYYIIVYKNKDILFCK